MLKTITIQKKEKTQLAWIPMVLSILKKAPVVLLGLFSVLIWIFFS